MNKIKTTSNIIEPTIVNESNSEFAPVNAVMDKVFSRLYKKYDENGLSYFPMRSKLKDNYDVQIHYYGDYVTTYTINEDDIEDEDFIAELVEELDNQLQELNQSPVVESATKLYKDSGDTVKNGSMMFILIDQNEEDSLLQKVIVDEAGEIKEKCEYYVVAWGLQPDGTWNQGHYFTDEASAKKAFNDRRKNRLTESDETSSFKDKIESNTTARTMVEIIKKYGYECAIPFIQATGGVYLNIQPTEKYQPNIYWYPAKRGATGTLKISNKSYGGLELSEYEKVLKACQSAFDMCNELMAIDMTKLEKEPEDSE